MPSWLQFDAAAHELRVTPGPEAAAFARSGRNTLDLEVRAVDQAGAQSASTSLTVTVEAPCPTCSTRRPKIFTAFEDLGFDSTAPHGRFTADDTSVLTATRADGLPLPAWLQFDPATGTFSGTPGNADVDDFSVQHHRRPMPPVTRTRRASGSSSRTRTTPFAIGTLGDESFVEGEPVRIELPATDTLFDDADLMHGDELTLSAPGKPDWLHFDPQNGTFSAQKSPDVSADETTTITLVATDEAGATTELAFDLTVETTNHAPMLKTEIRSAPDATEGEDYYWNLGADFFIEPRRRPAHLDRRRAPTGCASTRTPTTLPADPATPTPATPRSRSSRAIPAG